MICVFLGKQDFKHLLKWQMHTRKAFLPSPKVKSKATNTENYKEKGDEDNHVLKEMEELSYAVECRKQQPKKLLAKTRAKDKIRKAAGMNTDATEDGYQDHELFSLASIKA
ncbi:uncharacterized protein [Aristolochia californica]|uniref:uncharacterized protein isoform X2 n=1 Tax=Aristolochia californica TaxID=171875 RepID=UPI0035D5CD60